MGDATPPVSFVIPTRNHAPFIRQCLDSCLGQSIAGAEILVIDGASTDGTVAILESYGERVRFISEPDRGQSDAVNKGIALARGEIIAWLNSDDYYADSRVLGDVLAAFAADGRLDVVHGDGLLVDVSGIPIRRAAGSQLDGGRRLLVHHSLVMQPSVFFRRALFVEVGGLDEQLHWAMDYDLWLRMLPAARGVRYLPRLMACTRAHRDAKTFAHMLDQIREVRALKRRHRDAFGAGFGDRLAMGVGDVALYLYWAAVRLGLRKAA